jgi:beta-mannosidase
MPQSLISPSNFAEIRVPGNWKVQAVPLKVDFCPQMLGQAWIDVPECAHLQTVLYPRRPYWGEHLRAINQQAWVYQRTLKVPTGDYRRARLRFEGIDYFAEVWINEHLLGRHEGHFAPFDLDATSFLFADDLTLTVRVSAPWDRPNPHGTYPTDHVIRGLVKGLYEHGEGVIPPDVNPIGIWRPVRLLLDQGLSIDHIGIRTDLDGQVDMAIRISAIDSWQGRLELTIDPENHAGSGITVSRQVSLLPGIHVSEETLRLSAPRWWWPWDHGSPNLYRLTARLLDNDGQAVSAIQRCFGVRTVRLERSPRRFSYWINERPVYLRGSSYIPSLYLSECSEDSLAHDLALARAANLNLLRTHVHVAPQEFYELCDRTGMLVWQDFELNWIHDPSPEFEQRAITLQREMIDLLGNHPSIIAWVCHNEPTMIFARRDNLESRPDPALYTDAQRQDATRPVFICSGQLQDDWQRSGDTHSYYGGVWTKHYTDVYAHHPRLNTEFGFEAPAAAETLRAFPDAWERLRHLEGQIDVLWEYQAALIQYQVEHYRRLRSQSCAGYIHFWLVDLAPQVGFGVLDAYRIPKGGYEALRRASQPLQVMLEYNRRRPIALWILNDTPNDYPAVRVSWRVEDLEGRLLLEDAAPFDIQPNASQRVLALNWSIAPAHCAHITLRVYQSTGELLCQNEYHQPFQPHRRPPGYPWKFDPYLGTKVFDRCGAPSLADQSESALVRRVPLTLREWVAEWILRQQLPSGLISRIARLVGAILG